IRCLSKGFPLPEIILVASSILIRQIKGLNLLCLLEINQSMRIVIVKIIIYILEKFRNPARGISRASATC
ncbi:hypothetical protein KKB18_04480, partial [bacterium]|nr:hypothetical protein [bacterium]